MIKVITYGTFDLLHEGHINILKRAKALGDYLYVGVTTENFDISRGKINVQQSLMERIEAVKATGIADEVFPEEYVGQKIDDIKRNNINIFAIGSDWKGKFDYLNEYCQVIYLPRTEGVSSTQLRSDHAVKLGTIGSDPSMEKMVYASKSIDGLSMGSVTFDEEYYGKGECFNAVYPLPYKKIFSSVDAVYVATRPEKRYETIKDTLSFGKHVIANSPIALSERECIELQTLAKEKNLLLFDSIKTAYLLSFARLILLVKGGAIGEVKSIDVTCTSLENLSWTMATKYYTSFTDWGSIALLPIFKILGCNYESVSFSTLNSEEMKDIFTKVNFIYKDALATVSVGLGVKSEGDMRISGTKGYIYVPSPWWKSEYFELRFEDPAQNKPHYYKSENEGLSMELVHFARCIKHSEQNFYVEEEITRSICKVMEQYINTLK
jgi:choline-phosphate cytidylyltransferase